MSAFLLPQTFLAVTLLLCLECQAASYKLACGDVGDLSTISMRDKFRFQTRGYGRKNYPNNDDCDWSIELGANCTEMRINCHRGFSIEDWGPNCDADFLVIDDGSSEDRYCGTNRPNFRTTVDSLFIAFSSDSSVRDVGMRCFARCTSTGQQLSSTSEQPPQEPMTTTSTISIPSSNSSIISTNSTTTSSPLPPQASCVCGKVNRETRIVGGQVTEVNEYPWQAALVRPGGNRPFCGGTLINEQWVLTAAHCTAGATKSSLQVILGEHNWNSDTETKEHRYNVESIIDHPEYNDDTLDNDFSLLKLTEAVNYDDSDYDHVRPACWPTQEVPVGATAIVTGWGYTSEGGSQSQNLREVALPVVSCNDAFSSGTTANMICAGNLAEGGIDSCQGDSGGPFVWRVLNSFEIQGVVSWGIGCARPGWPGVYAKVLAALPWITTTTGGNSTCTRDDTSSITGK